MRNSLLCSGCSRRHFLGQITSGLCCATGGLLLGGASPARAAGAVTTGKPKVRVVFCETTNDKPIWPNIGYDFAARRQRLMRVLAQGCSKIQFIETVVLDKPADAEQVIKADAGIDGYIVCTQGLGWHNDLNRLCTTGKPTLLADNLFGGSGHFLLQLSPILKAGKPVDWVSSSDDHDLVASARQFALLQTGKSASEISDAFAKTRREHTPRARNWHCKPDPVRKPDFDEAFRELRSTKILVVGGGWGGDEFRKAAAEVVGVQFIPIDFKALAAAWEQADQTSARDFAERWISGAQKVVEPQRAEIEKSGAMYVGMKQLMAQHDAQGVSINCLGGFYGGHLKAYPCLGFCEFNNIGLVGGCEGDQMSALTMATMTALTGRPGFISDPVIDTSKANIIYAHCVATTHPFGQQGPANPYCIRSHSEDRKGAALQSLLPADYMTTTLEINPQTKEIVMHQAKTTGNNSSDMACRTKVEAVVKGDIEKLTENWHMGWHRVTFYGDHKDTVVELADRLKLKLIQEA